MRETIVQYKRQMHDLQQQQLAKLQIADIDLDRREKKSHIPEPPERDRMFPEITRLRSHN